MYSIQVPKRLGDSILVTGCPEGSYPIFEVCLKFTGRYMKVVEGSIPQPSTNDEKLQSPKPETDLDNTDEEKKI